MSVPGISVSASSTQITMGGSVTIRWAVDGAPGAELLDYTSSQWKAVPLSGSRAYTLPPNQGNYNFFIRATGPGGSAQNYVRVDVLKSAPMVSPAVAAVTPAVTVNPPATTTPAAQGIVPPAATAPSVLGDISSNYLLLAAGAALLFLVFGGKSK